MTAQAGAPPPAPGEALAAREARYLRRLALARGLPPGGVLVSFTLRAPWSARVDPAHAPAARALFEELAAELAALPGLSILARGYGLSADGPEGQLSLVLAGGTDGAAPAANAAAAPTAAAEAAAARLSPARTVKLATVAFEGKHPLGELADVDVMGEGGAGLAREDLGLPPRACLVCGGRAVECAAGRAHPPEEVLARVAAILARYPK